MPAGGIEKDARIAELEDMIEDILNQNEGLRRLLQEREDDEESDEDYVF